jgi:hypothetical protein
MSHIMMCLSEECPIKSKCYRFMSICIDGKHCQDFSHFYELCFNIANNICLKFEPINGRKIRSNTEKNFVNEIKKNDRT